MKELNDENIQKLLEEGSGHRVDNPADKDFKVYQVLFKELRKEPALELSADFSKKVTAGLQAKEDRISDIKSYLLFACILLCGLVGAYNSLAVINYEYLSLLITAISQYKEILLFGLICLAIIQYLDFRIVKRRIHPSGLV